MSLPLQGRLLTMLSLLVLKCAKCLLKFTSFVSTLCECLRDFLKIASLSFSSLVLWIVKVCNRGHQTLGLQHLKCFAQGALVSFGNNRGNLHLRSEP